MGHQMLLITALVLLVATAIGYWKGFLKMALSIAALILSFVIVLALNPYVKGFLREKTPVYQNVRSAIAEVMEGDEELENNKAKMKEMSSGKEIEISLSKEGFIKGLIRAQSKLFQ